MSYNDFILWSLVFIYVVLAYLVWRDYRNGE